MYSFSYSSSSPPDAEIVPEIEMFKKNEIQGLRVWCLTNQIECRTGVPSNGPKYDAFTLGSDHIQFCTISGLKKTRAIVSTRI